MPVCRATGCHAYLNIRTVQRPEGSAYVISRKASHGGDVLSLGKLREVLIELTHDGFKHRKVPRCPRVFHGRPFALTRRCHSCRYSPLCSEAPGCADDQTRRSMTHNRPSG